MKNLLVALSLVALSLTGCTKVDPTEGTPAARGTTADARATGKRHTVTVTGTFETLVNFPTDGPPFVTGTGQLSHLGKSTFLDYPVLNFSTLSGTGTRTLTAANGDQLVGTLSITLVPIKEVPGTFTVQVTFNITSGTGRFTGATGYLYGTDILNPNNPAGSATFSGPVTY